ncbi:IS110 family transposase [Gordonia sihwensis]|uniref:IS110 family transposase n=1 Tax=Gordonia sp. SND2 TaxID=3388659 RepID=UPI002416CBD0|nr:IS110 family transposase [Gordonia sihwensis]WFN93193.1 IS110 family transposase [Gordonia sihwensis]
MRRKSAVSIVADVYRFVVGVDTHAATHSYCLVEAATARTVDQATFPTSSAGLRRAIAWIERRTGTRIRETLISVEGSSSYGTRLTRELLRAGYRVVDAPSPRRERGGSKTDAIDAHKAAVTMLARPSDGLADARTGDLHECLKTLLPARDRMTREKTRQFNAMVALLREHDLGIDARGKPTLTIVKQIARWRERPSDSRAKQFARAEVITLAQRIVALHVQLAQNLAAVRELVAAHAPVLLELPGVGPISAGLILNAWAYRGRVKSEAAWAALAGVSPIEVSSGQRQYRRLNRGGDRQLNRALHAIVLTNSRCDQQTKEFIAARITQGKSPRAIRRILKRYLARRIYRILNQPGAVTTAA